MITEEQFTAWNNAAINGTIPDEENPIFIFCQTSTSLLIELLSENLDVKELIRHQLKGRGLDETGRFVGLKR